MKPEDRTNAINDIITGIARRSAYKFKTRSVEDLSQELWVKILEKENSVGYCLDLNLIAKICYDTIVDIQRYDIVRNCLYLEEVTESLHSPYPSDNVNKILLDDLINIFPKNSKEQYFLEYWYTASGYSDFLIEGNGKNKEGFTESDLAIKLGYSSSSSGGFRKFRSKIRKFVTKFTQE